MNESKDIKTRLQEISLFIKTTNILVQKEIKEIKDMVTKFEEENVKIHLKLLDKINTLEKNNNVDENNKTEKSTFVTPTGLFGKSNAQKTFNLLSKEEKPEAFGDGKKTFDLPSKEENLLTFDGSCQSKFDGVPFGSWPHGRPSGLF